CWLGLSLSRLSLCWTGGSSPLVSPMGTIRRQPLQLSSWTRLARTSPLIPTTGNHSPRLPQPPWDPKC
ncbi:unnamed protein product, partial [Arctogadus glacialis]